MFYLKNKLQFLNYFFKIYIKTILSIVKIFKNYIKNLLLLSLAITIVSSQYFAFIFLFDRSYFIKNIMVFTISVL